jgi:RNA polymerase sigma-70 factor (ECF subfamily)
MRHGATMKRSEADADVIEACRQGDRDAFRQLFVTYKDTVYTMALHFTGNDAQACDITQQVFLKLFSKIDQFQGASKFSTWLYRIVANACEDERRKTKRLVPISTRPETGPMETKRPQEERVYRREIAASVRDAISELSPKLRLPILLRYVEGLSYEEIADTLGCSKGTVASRMNRGHKALAKRLGHLRHVLQQEVRS